MWTYYPELLATPVPRYTSYPTAPHFHTGIDRDTYAGWLAELPSDMPLSLYMHVPFCDRLCWFCGCHTKQVLRYDPIAAYLRAKRAWFIIDREGIIKDARAKRGFEKPAERRRRKKKVKNFSAYLRKKWDNV